MSEYNIRPAEEGDCEDILRLRQELAVYNKTPGLELTAEKLRKDGFGEQKCFECLVVEDTKATASQDKFVLWGYALYFYVYSTWSGRVIFLEDLFLSEEHRGRGIRSKLFHEVAQIGLAQDCQRMKWEVYAWNKPSIDFYKKRGGCNVTESA
ncbi:diamine acetyltransferase 2-like, partial [Pecten maximus]|uniref:diamine acetyltransferase 2-like n=1 Tax=Pecten maximus TaxID=6579 RepID=UPI0014584C48